MSKFHLVSNVIAISIAALVHALLTAIPKLGIRHSNRTARHSSRAGASVIEFAICLPVFFLIAIGTVETCRMVYLRQSLKITAYECARVAIVPGTSDFDVQNQCDAILLGRRIKDYELKTTPESVSSLKYGDLYTVSISLPAEPNALVGAWFYKNKILQETVTIMAEF